MRSPWDKEYDLHKEYIWGTGPTEFAREAATYFQNRKAITLDLGCGEGRDTVFFARCGFEVTGVDISTSGVRKAEQLAITNNVKARLITDDMAHFAFDGEYDLIFSCGAIHYVERRKRRDLFERMKVNTKLGGMHAILVFNDQLIYVEKDEVIDYFRDGELKAHYYDWTIINEDDYSIHCEQDETKHLHGVTKIIAKRTRA